MNKQEINDAIDKLETEIRNIESEKYEARRKAEAPFEAKIQEVRAEIREYTGMLAEMAGLSVGDVIFNSSTGRGFGKMVIIYIDGDRKFRAVNIKKNGEQGEIYKDFYINDKEPMKGYGYEVIQKAGSPAPEKEVTLSDLTKALSAAKVKVSKTESFRRGGRTNGVYFTEQSRTFELNAYVKRYVHTKESTAEGNVLKAKYMMEAVLALTAAGYIVTKTNRKKQFSGEEDVYVIEKYPTTKKEEVA